MDAVTIFFNESATTEIYTLSLHDALPIFDEFGFDPELADQAFQPLLRLLYREWFRTEVFGVERLPEKTAALVVANQDRKSTRLNSSHANISYAVFCLKKKLYTLVSLTAVC